MDTDVQVLDAYCPDGNGGVVACWNGGGETTTFRSQRMTSVGVRAWQEEGTLLSETVSFYCYAAAVPDGASGAIVAWGDTRTFVDTGFDVYAQRIDADGAQEWGSEDIPLSTAKEGQALAGNVVAVSDSAGGAIVVWEDQRFIVPRAYAQHVSAEGITHWLKNGIPLTSRRTGNTASPFTVSDQHGGVYVAWIELGSLEPLPVQHVLGSGRIAAGWPTTGRPLSLTTGDNVIGVPVPGGAVFAWQATRTAESYRDIYAQRVLFNGALGEPWFDEDLDGHAKDLRDTAKERAGSLDFILPKEGSVELVAYSVDGRLVARSNPTRLGAGPHSLRIRQALPDVTRPGVYIVRCLYLGKTVATSISFLVP